MRGPVDKDPELSAPAIASRMRWSQYTALRRLRALAAMGKARRVPGKRGGRPKLVARVSVLEEVIPGFAESRRTEEKFAELTARVEELEGRVNALASRMGGAR